MLTHATPFFLVLSTACPLLAAPPAVTVHADRPVHSIPPSLWGVFLEEVNHACESGLYAELLRNRRFREPPANNDPIPGWNAPGRPSTIVRDDVGLTWTPSAGETLVSSGFWGVPVLPKSSYTLRIDTGALTGEGHLLAALRSETGETLASQSLTLKPNSTCSVTLTPTNLGGPLPHSTLVLTSPAAGTIQLRMVSLFPPTFRDHPNGLRRDLAALIENLQPAFIRFPGGCFVEGGDFLRDAFRWPDTIGDIAARPGHRNAIWEYWSSDGLGYHEYLQLCEDLHADPLYVFNCGLSHKEAVPLAQLQPWIDEALHSIDYANAPADAPMGALRAKNGHPAPFNLKYAEIGNENGMFNDFGGTRQQYAERYRAFESQLKKHHPGVLTVADTRIDAPADLVDDHYYNSVAWFWQNEHLYDKTPRTGPRIYVGEYAVTQGCGLGNLDAALAEAAFMIGLERNSDLVTMASYAPMFVRAEDRKWNPAMIVFDGTRALGTPSYHVQAMFAHSRADRLLACDLPEFPSRPVLTTGSVGVGTWRTQAEYKDISVEVNGKTIRPALASPALKPLHGQWSVTDGVCTQSSKDEHCLTLIDLPELRDASNYTVRAKARKTGGDEGFMLLFRARSEHDCSWWIVGGWGNHQHAVERTVAGAKAIVGPQTPGTIETNRWYDLRVELQDEHIRCYLDDTLVQSVEDRPPARFAFEAVSVAGTGEIILRAVNGENTPQPLTIELAGLSASPLAGTATILTSASLADENTLDRPTAISPKDQPFHAASPKFDYAFPPRSLTMLRLKAAK